MLHEAHPGIARMKSFARGYVWWPNMDESIEDCVKECTICQSDRKAPPPIPLHPWAWPERPWSRIHIDYAGPFEGKMFLLIIDAHSKWLDIYMTTSSTATTTIELLRRSFATFGLPEVLVSDNASAFTSEEFSQFLRRNGVRHVRTPPYHPALNGVVERAVQTFKEGMKHLKDGSISTRLSRFLFKYRIIPHSTTGMSPAELLYGRRMRSQMDNLRPQMGGKIQQSLSRQQRNHDSHSRSREWVVGEDVYAMNYGPGSKWLPGKVIGLEGSVVYSIELEDGRKVKRHADQLRSRQSGQLKRNKNNTQADEENTTCDDDGFLEDISVGEPSNNQTETEGNEIQQQENATPPSVEQEQQRHSGDTVRQEQAPPETQTRRSSRERHPPVRYGD